MGLKKIRNHIAAHLTNSRGWKTDRKIVVIESDDWGSIRMPSRIAYKEMRSRGVPVEKSPYLRHDSLASEEDLQLLFGLLRSHTSRAGDYPVITANCVVANPDFEQIRASEFREYSSESILETFKRYPEHRDCIEIWKEGESEHIFRPQSHGKEHLNISHWLHLLQNDTNDFRIAFENQCWGLSGDIYPGMKRSVQAAFDMEDRQDHKQHQISITEGLDLFEEIFGYRSRSFIANNYIWSTGLNDVLAQGGVRYLQGMKYQKLPILYHDKRQMIRHYVGERNNLGQYYLVRNCSFEPSLEHRSYNNVKECLRSITTSFLWKRPAIICSHRINYVGFLNADNRNRNLEQFNRLLASIIKKWPDVEFMSSDQLGQVIEEDGQPLTD